MTPELALIDMDGTVYYGEEPVEGVNDALDYLRDRGVETFFLTNYAGAERNSYSEKLESMGIDASADDVVTSGWLTARYISQKHPEADVFVLGEEGLKKEIRNQGIKVAETCESPDIVVLSNKHDLNYVDLTEVLRGVDEDTLLLGTNPDETIPGEGGEIPGAGAIISAVESMTGKEATLIGKPSENTVKTVTEMKDVSPQDCMMIGDRINTDMLMGQENGMETVLVLSGVTDRSQADSSDIDPDHVLDSIADISSVF